ncbi:MAG: YtxH domain-containing protein [Bacteroidetes bacterium]|nr:YtxH domain-containing protein [Bacteroidota bacterium]
MRTNAKFIYSVLAGAGLGAIVGYFFTTSKGNRLRNNAMNNAKDLGYTISDKVKEGVDRITEKVSDVRGDYRNEMEDISENIQGGFDKVKSKGSRFVGRRK